jgi:hypothetical protein
MRAPMISGTGKGDHAAHIVSRDDDVLTARLFGGGEDDVGNSAFLGRGRRVFGIADSRQIERQDIMVLSEFGKDAFPGQAGLGPAMQQDQTGFSGLACLASRERQAVEHHLIHLGHDRLRKKSERRQARRVPPRFALVLAGAKAFLEHAIMLNRAPDHCPVGLPSDADNHHLRREQYS